MAGKKFAAEFALRRNVSALDKILIQDSDDDVVKYAYPPQIAALSGYAYAKSIADLPLMPSNKSIGYIVGQMLYIYVGMGGDTKDGLYQSVGFFVGPQGVQGEKGEQGERGEQGIQGPKGDNGGLSLQEVDAHLATKQYVTADTLAEMLADYVSNTSLMRDYVTIAKAQDVTGVKNFTAGVQFGGLPMYKSKDDTVYLDANLVVRGAVTMYGLNTTTSPSIFSTLPIDGTTIGRNERGELYVIGGTSGGGGGTGGGISIADVENYLTGNGYITSDALKPYALKTAIPTSLKNPTALSWSGYSSGSYDGSTAQSIALPTKLSQLTDDVVNGKYLPITGGTVNGAITINDYAKITNDLYLGGVLRNANATWLLGESAPDGILTIGSGSYAQERCLHNYNGKLRLTAEGGVEAQLTFLDSDPTLGALDTKGVVRQVAGSYGWGLYSWVRNTGNGYIQVGSDSRYAASEAFNLILQVLGGNVAIGGTTASEKLHVYGNMLFDGERVLKSSLIGEVLYMGGSYLVIGGGTTAKGIPTYIDGKTVYVRAGNYVATFSDAGGLTWNGNLLTNGAITMYYSSDRRLKQNVRKVNASKTLMSLGGIYQYEYIDSEVAKNSTYGGSHYGLIYQNVKGTALSTMCHEREDGFGALNYLDTNFISLIAGATMENISEVEKLKEENKALRRRVEQLEKRIA